MNALLHSMHHRKRLHLLLFLLPFLVFSTLFMASLRALAAEEKTQGIPTQGEKPIYQNRASGGSGSSWSFNWQVNQVKGGTNAFYRFLDANRGKAVFLSLTLTPRQEKDSKGYELKLLGDTKTAGDNKEENENSHLKKITCGRNGVLGNIDNYETDYLLIFQHPEHYHAPVTLRIGDRKHYPFQMIWCGVENYTDNALTSLHIRGNFVVMSAPLPTAVAYDLYPVNRAR